MRYRHSNAVGRIVRSAFVGTMVFSWLTLSAVELPGWSGGVANAQTNSRAQAEAQQRFNRAVQLYEDEDYEASLVEFRKAYELVPNYKLLYQIGQVSFRLKDYAGAYQAFERYLADGAGDITPERRRQVQEEANTARERTGRLVVTANVSGAVVTVDDVDKGKIPLSNSLLVSVGKRKVTVSAEGRPEVTQTVTVVGQETYKLKFDIPEAKKESEPATTTKESPPLMTAWSWAGIGTTVAFGVGATIFGVASLGAESDLKDMTYSGKPDSKIKDQQSKIDNMALASDIFTAAAVITLGTTLILTFTRDTSPESSTQASTKTVSRGIAKPEIKPSIGLGSVGITGTF